MAAGISYTPIATTTLGSAQSSVTFSGISQTYTDLVLVINGSSSASGTAIVTYNSDSGSNYSNTGLNGNGSSASSFRLTSNTYLVLGEMYNYNCTLINQIQNYSNTTTFKTSLGRANSASNFVQTNVGLWRSTSAVSSLQLYVSGANWNSGSTFSLYGITAA
jgi:hypothetical protein